MSTGYERKGIDQNSTNQFKRREYYMRINCEKKLSRGKLFQVRCCSVKKSCCAGLGFLCLKSGSGFSPSPYSPCFWCSRLKETHLSTYFVILQVEKEVLPSETSWFLVFSPLFICDGLNAYFCIIVFIRQYLDRLADIFIAVYNG